MRRLGWAILGKAAYVVECLAAAVLLVVAGYAHQLVSLTNQIGDGARVSVGVGVEGTGGSSVGAMNILVMGLESRTNFEGQPLSVQELTETHSGNEQSVSTGQIGAQDTDTLILIHVFAGGQKAVGFSIPRDDVVDFPHATFDGLTEGKIDAAYDYAYNESLAQTAGTSMSSNQRYLLANQAGQLFTVQTVESVTGVHIDHFVESNIIGFYYLAQQFGGIEVCIKPAPAQDGLPAGANLTDADPLTGTDNSGFSAYKDGYNAKQGGAQYLHLSPAQSLAYVRSRDTLPGVDIGRTARQQAVLDYAIWKLRTGGVLSDLTAITNLLSNAKNYLITDSGWDLPGFAADMNALSGKNLHFTTLPAAPTNGVEVPGYPGLQSVNYINVPQIQQLVQDAFYGSAPQAPPASSVTVDVYNGSGTYGLEEEVSQGLVALGYKAGQVSASAPQSQPAQADTEVFYGPGAALSGQAIADDMGTTAAPLSSLPQGHVEVLLGSTVTAVPPGLLTYGAATVTADDYTSTAQADNLPVPSGTPTGTPTAGASPTPTTSASPTPASTSSPSGSAASGGTRSPSASPPYGLTSCPY